VRVMFKNPVPLTPGSPLGYDESPIDKAGCKTGAGQGDQGCVLAPIRSPKAANKRPPYLNHPGLKFAYATPSLQFKHPLDSARERS
jgi:hypothetical protein